MSSKAPISVVISTFNRADTLPRALAALQTQNPALLREIIVVDNASTDTTRAVVEAWKDKSKFPLLYFLETQMGVSHARNRGVREAGGEIVAMIDDDGIAEPNWLDEVWAGFQKDNVACTGGKVLLEWDGLKRPAWLTHYFVHTLSYFELPYDNERLVTKPQEFPIGCNIAVRKDWFFRVGGFDPNRGRKGFSLEEGEETALQSAIHAAGGGILYNPRSRVHHLVLPNKIEKAFFYRFYRGKALGLARSVRASLGGSRRRAALHFALRIPVWMVRTLLALPRADARFYSLLQIILNAHALRFCLSRGHLP